MTDLPAHTCTICRRRQYERAHVCEHCRAGIPGTLAAVVELHAELAHTSPPNTGATERVSGTSTPRIPIAVDIIDLAAPASTGEASEAARQWPQDQIGHISVASVLDSWVRDWADIRGEHLPAPTVPWLAQWLTHRLGWACDEHPAVKEFADEIRDLEKTLRRITGVDRDDTQRIGWCRGSHGQPCGAELRVTPWQDVAECPRCSARWPRVTWLTLRRAA